MIFLCVQERKKLNVSGLAISVLVTVRARTYTALETALDASAPEAGALNDDPKEKVSCSSNSNRDLSAAVPLLLCPMLFHPLSQPFISTQQQPRTASCHHKHSHADITAQHCIRLHFIALHGDRCCDDRMRNQRQHSNRKQQSDSSGSLMTHS